jgi:hypothetical protein
MAEELPLYVREPPELHPAIVGCLDRRGGVTGAEVMASLLALVADGALTTRSSVRRVTTIASAHDTDVTELRVVPERWMDLDPLDRALVTFLTDAIGGAGVLTLADVQAAARSRPTGFRQGLVPWKAMVVSRTQDLGLLRGRTRTPTGDAEWRRHQAFRRYLTDFGTLGDEPPVAVALWGRYLAFAVLFGIGERVARELDLEGPGVAAAPDLATWKAWLGLD